MKRVVTHSLIHLFHTPSRKREDDRVTQLLLGAEVEALGQTHDGEWALVQGDDAYRGWAETRWLAPLAADEFALVGVPFADVRGEESLSSPLLVRLSIGSRVTVRERGAELTQIVLPNGPPGFVASSALAPLPTFAPDALAAAAAGYAAWFLGTPYIWGGSSAFGLDCSGMAQLCYRLAGIVLRRDADIQRDDPRFVAVEKDALAPGDLIFFGENERITHVALQLDATHFIHATGGAGVIVTPWDDPQHSPGFRDARRLDPDRAHEPIVRVEAPNR